MKRCENEDKCGGQGRPSGWSGIDVSEEREEETQCWGSISVGESLEPIKDPRQCLQKERWDRYEEDQIRGNEKKEGKDDGCEEREGGSGEWRQTRRGLIERVYVALAADLDLSLLFNLS